MHVCHILSFVFSDPSEGLRTIMTKPSTSSDDWICFAIFACNRLGVQSLLEQNTYSSSMNGRVGGNEWLICAVCHPPILIFRRIGCPGCPAVLSITYRGWPPPSEADVAPAFLHRERRQFFKKKIRNPLS